MDVAFPWPVRLMSQTPALEGLRHDPFVNIDGESFAKPTLNGFWRIDMQVVARTTQAKLAVSAFITRMSTAGATCQVPVCGVARPNGSNGRMLIGCSVAPEYTFDHVGFDDAPFDGYVLHADAARRDSRITVTRPELSRLWPGHFISLGDRLHQVVDVEDIGPVDDCLLRVSVMPNLRNAHAAGEIVIVDHLRLRCMMQSGEQVGLSNQPVRTPGLTFVEAF